MNRCNLSHKYCFGLLPFLIASTVERHTAAPGRILFLRATTDCGFQLCELWLSRNRET